MKERKEMMNNSRRPKGRYHAVARTCLLTLAALVALSAQEAQGQWATSGDNITNTNTGNVGIGTASPAAKLDVSGSATFSGTTTVAGRGIFSIDGSNNLNLSMYNHFKINASTVITHGASEIYDNYFGMRYTPSNTLTVRIPASGSAYFNQGNVGINTTAPVGFFNVTGGGTNHYDASSQNVLINAQQGSITAGQSRHSIFGSVNINHDDNTTSGVYGHATGSDALNMTSGSMAGVRGYAVAPRYTTFNNAFATYGGHFVAENPYTTSHGNPHYIYGIYAKAGSSFGTASEVLYAGYFENNVTAGNDAYGIFQVTPGVKNYFAGNVGIGTTSPATRLDVAGQVKSSSGGFVFPDGTVQTTAATGSGSVNAANVSAGQFGAGNFSFPGNVDISGGVTWGASSSRTDWKSDAGAIASRSGFFETASPINYPAGATSWWHMLESRHSNPANNYALQIAGSFFDQNLYARKTNNNGATAWSKIVLQDSAGNTSVGASSASTLNVTGNINVSGNINAKYQDVAEWVPSSQQLEAGTVVALDPEKSNHVLASSEAYDTRVAGVISAQPGISLGDRGEGKVLVATTGRVKVRVDATRAPIKIGDLLVTSDVQGVAMKSEPVSIGGRRMHSPGTIIGKALEPLQKGTGEILVLLSLQ